MGRININSSNLLSVGYNEGEQVLEIEFRDGSIYQYSGVSTETYEGLMSAVSHGKYFDQNIKDIYPYSKI